MIDTGEEIPGLRETPRGRGCLFWGCVTLILITVVVGGCIALALLWFYTDLRDFSSAEPVAVPVVESSDEEYEEARKKIETLARQEASRLPGEFVITTDDLNALIARDEAARDQKLAGRLHVRGEGDSLLVDVSWPLDDFLWLSDRHFNGTLRVALELMHGEVKVTVTEGTSTEGKKLSKTLRESAGQVLTERLNGAFADFIDGVGSLEVQDGRIILGPAVETP